MESNRRQTLGDITHDVNSTLDSLVHPRTIQRALYDRLGMHSCHACEKPYLKPNHIERRLKWADDYIGYGKEDWHRVIWTDESSVELGKMSSASLVWRRTNEAFKEECLAPTFKSGRSSVMIWVCIAHGRKGPLIFILKDQWKGVDYIDLVLAGPLFDFYMEICEERGVAKVMEDGAPIHICKVAKKFKDSHFVDALPYSAQSLDMNLIEHIWYLLKIAINKRQQRPRNVKELKEALLEEWEKIDIKVINSLINSIENQVQELKDNKGKSTRF